MHLMGYKHCLHSLHLMSRNFFVRLYNSRFATEAPVIFFRFQSNIWGSSAYSYLSNKRSSTIILFDKHIHCASFGKFWVQLSQLFESQWVLKVPWEIVFGDFFLRRWRNPDISRIFKDSLWLEYLTDLDSKGTKRSAMNRAMNF